ncbi:MAG: hypothetical protein GTO54_10495 [Nitrososphaeria archaeon]|nr:hypothetical protein [Nitrososphaeria archaeon]
MEIYLLIPIHSMVDLFIFLIGLIILWAIVSIPVYLSAKIVTGGRASFGGAMGATLLGPLVYFIVLFGVSFFLGSVIGGSSFVWALILAFLAWVAVFKSVFETGWLGALGIAILAVVIFIILSIMLGLLFGVTILGTFL